MMHNKTTTNAQNKSEINVMTNLKCIHSSSKQHLASP